MFWILLVLWIFVLICNTILVIGLEFYDARTDKYHIFKIQCILGLMFASLIPIVDIVLFLGLCYETITKILGNDPLWYLNNLITKLCRTGLDEK